MCFTDEQIKQVHEIKKRFGAGGFDKHIGDNIANRTPLTPSESEGWSKRNLNPIIERMLSENCPGDG